MMKRISSRKKTRRKSTVKNEKAVAAERQEELARWERRCRKIQHGLRIAMMVMVLFTGVMTMAFRCV